MGAEQPPAQEGRHRAPRRVSRRAEKQSTPALLRHQRAPARRNRGGPG